MLQAIDCDLWIADQPIKYFGLEVGTRMTVVRLPSDRSPGQLLVISPIRPEDPLIMDLNALGTVSDIVAPNLFHHLFAGQFKRLYPEATLWADAELSLKRPDLPITRQFPPHPQRTFLEGLELLPVAGFCTLDTKGFSPLNEWVFFHQSSQTLIITDLAYFFDDSSATPIRWASKVLGGYNQLRPSWLEKIASRNRSQLKASIQAILEWDFTRVIMAHGSILELDAKAQFRQGYEWFLDESL